MTVAVTATAAMLATLTATYLSGGSLPGFTAGAQARPQGQGALAACATRYTAREHRNGSFTASLTITNTGDGTLAGWSLSFALPAGQRLTSADGARWTSTGPRVTLHSDSFVPAGRTARVSLTGTFADGGDAPTGFALDGMGCQQVSTIVRTAGTPGKTATGNSAMPDRHPGTPAPEPSSPAASTRPSPAASSTSARPSPAASASAGSSARPFPFASAFPSASAAPSVSAAPPTGAGPRLIASAPPVPSASGSPTPTDVP